MAGRARKAVEIPARSFTPRRWQDTRADLVRRAGFARAEIFGGLDGGPYGRDASRLAVVGYCTPNCSR